MTATAAVRVEELPDGRPAPAYGSPGTSVAAVTPIAMPSAIDIKALERALETIEDPEWLKLQKRFANAFDVACKALLSDNDVQKEGKGDNAREFKKKSAWRKLGRHFGVSTRVVGDPAYEVVGKAVVARVTVEGVSSWGHSTQAVGACGTDEESGRRKITLADAVATAETRATNRAISNLIAMGEVSYEEVAKNEVAERGVADLTLEDARAYPFPWRKPEKYADKPMGNLSYKMLETVRDAIANEIEKQGKTAKRAEILRVCELLLEDIENREADGDGVVEDEQRLTPTNGGGSPPTSPAGSTSPTATSARTATDPATPAGADQPNGGSFADEYAGQPLRSDEKASTKPPPAKGAPDSVYALTQRFNQLAGYLTPDMREDTERDLRASAKRGAAKHLAYLQQSIKSMEELLAGALDEKELDALGIDTIPPFDR